ncbi:lysozyme inhibitor LprI family protein [Falsigemmobacter faecalis]|uniref:DUF1311 domain-containing protein n=1 Tax=Falsigemmobacter faecalis TaxID=2488730 RepID=A0A3P3DRJ8_9RHOB|nr:lysozyme inhibitor LprI family protein [Falsigemmobacter faecalis]RRH76880.1 DUF1311 domain-containing protein [Falsigemmobacter faecalis]
MKLPALLVSLLLATPAFAQSFDSRLTTQCLEAAEPKGGQQAALCIGTSASACFETPGGGTTVGMADCLAAEVKLWDDLLNAAWKEAVTVARAMDQNNKDSSPAAPESVKSLREAQRAWISFRDATCRFEAERYYGGSVATLTSSSCFMELTALQAIRLRSIHSM